MPYKHDKAEMKFVFILKNTDTDVDFCCNEKPSLEDNAAATLS